MVGVSSGSTASSTERYPFGRPSVDWEKIAERMAEEMVRLSKDHRQHCLLWERLATPHDAHVKAWERWKVQPWTWKNYVAHGLNRFYQWLECGK